MPKTNGSVSQGWEIPEFLDANGRQTNATYYHHTTMSTNLTYPVVPPCPDNSHCWQCYIMFFLLLLLIFVVRKTQPLFLPFINFLRRKRLDCPDRLGKRDR
jgi:hypothetical protein